MLLSRTRFQSDDVTALVKLLNERPSDEGTVQRAWAKVVALSDPHILSRDFASLTAADRLLVGRSAVQKALALDSHYAPALFNDAAILTRMGNQEDAVMNLQARAKSLIVPF